MFSLEHILKYLDASTEQATDGSRRCIVEGESIVNSGHLLCCGLKSENGIGSNSEASGADAVNIFAMCMQTSNMSGQPHEINIRLKDTGEVVKAVCSCKAGLSGTCKHIVGSLLFVYRTTVAKLEVIGCTDVKVQWKQLGSKGKAAYGPCKVSELCHVNVDRSAKSDSAGSRTPVFHDLIRAAPKCSVSRHVRPVPTRHDVQPPKDIDHIITNTMTCASLDTHLQPPLLVGDSKDFYESAVLVDHSRSCRLAAFPQGSTEWSKERDVRITGSKCYALYTYDARGPNADWDKKLATLEKSRMFAGNSATRYGQKCEKPALELYKQMCEGEEVVKCGLVVPPKCPWLEFSPDGVVMKDGKPVRLVEVKSPVCGKTLTPSEMLTQNALPFIVFDGENGELKKHHQYYGQVQLGMAILSVQKCDFVIYGKDGIAIVPVYRDELFVQRLFQSLHSVFFRVILPHLCKQRATVP